MTTCVVVVLGLTRLVLPDPVFVVSRESLETVVAIVDCDIQAHKPRVLLTLHGFNPL
jgi:hypothetical protein